MELDASASDPAVPAIQRPQTPTLEQRAIAVVEVLLCSDFPTQIVLALTFARFGFQAQSPDGSLRIAFVAALSLADTALLVGLMLLFLTVRGDRPRDVFFGSRPWLAEARAGIPMIAAVFAIAAAVMLSTRALVPWLHNVDINPLEGLVQTLADAALFAVVAVVAGGIREELQRAFLLNRFERWLGGGMTGVIVTSLAFGTGHYIQGMDAAVATGALGAFWAVVYLRRRSVIAPMISHAGFNLLQLLQLAALGR